MKIQALDFKHPRTPHLPFSPGAKSDDVYIQDLSVLKNCTLSIAIKYDGECTSGKFDKTFARSLDSRNHKSREWFKEFWSRRQWLLQSNPKIKVTGENLYAKHTIHYKDDLKLQSYFYGFNVWMDDMCLDIEGTNLWFNHLGIMPVKEIYRGPWDEKLFIQLAEKLVNEGHEGYVVRNVSNFNLSDFNINVAKYVKHKFVQTDQHWMHGSVIKNELDDLADKKYL